MTAEQGLVAPRLEVLSVRLKLDEFCKSVIILLIGQTISPVVKEVLSRSGGGGSLSRSMMDPTASVKTLLRIFCTSFKEQVAKRIYFYKSSELVRRGVIKLAGPFGALHCTLLCLPLVCLPALL